MTTPQDERRPRFRGSVLAHRKVWHALLAWGAVWGALTWAIEAALLQMVPDAPAEPWHGVYRLVEALLWIAAIVLAICVAERWPITEPSRRWRRIAGQIALGLALGPVWGIIAYGLSPYLMPGWRPRGMWGIVAKEAKAMLFGYGTTALLAHVVLRVAAQRRRVLELAVSQQREAEAQLDLLRLELRPEGVLRAIDAIRELIPHDHDAANAALVLLADSLDTAMDAANMRELPLATECANIEAQVGLHRASGRPSVRCVVALDAGSQSGAVPHGMIQGFVDESLGVATTRSVELVVRIAARRCGRSLRIDVSAAPSDRDVIPDLVGRLASGRALTYAREQLRRHRSSELARCDVTAADDAATVALELPWRELAPDTRGRTTLADSSETHFHGQ